MSRVGDLSTRIFVGGLNNDVNELDLEKAFKLFGEITNVMVMRDKENGRSRGFAFVSFREKQASEEAINRMHGVEIRGRCVSVRHAEKEKFLSDDRSKRGGFRGGRIGHVGNRQDNLRGMAGSRGNGYRGRGGFFKPSDRVFVTDDRDDYQDHETGGASLRRSRSPPSESQRYYRHDESPPRDRRFSPEPPQRDEYSLPPYGHMPATRYEDGYYSQRPSSPPSNKFYGYETSQAMSPARERNAYIQARGLDYSPPPGRTTRKISPEQTQRRSPSPRRDQYHRESPKQKEYSIFSSESKHTLVDSRLEKRSHDTRKEATSKDNFRDRSTSPVGGKYRRVGSTYDDRSFEKSGVKSSFRKHSPQEKQQERHLNSQRGSQSRVLDRRQSPFSGGRSPGKSHAKILPASRKNETRLGYRKQSPEQRSFQRTKSQTSKRSPQRSPPDRYRSPERQNSSLRKSPAAYRSYQKEMTSSAEERKYRSPQKQRSPEMSRYKSQKTSPSRRSPARYGSSQRQKSPRYQSFDRQRSSPRRCTPPQTQRSPPTNFSKSSARYSSPERKVFPQQRHSVRERLPQRKSPGNHSGYQGRNNTNAYKGGGNAQFRGSVDNKRASFNDRRPERDDRRRDFGRPADRSPSSRRRSPVGAKSYY